MASKPAFKYRGNLRTSEDVSRRAKKSSGLYESAILDGFTPFKPKEGENAIRILPFTWEDTDKWGASWEIFVWVHSNIGPDRGTFICLDKMQGEPCPICEMRRHSEDDEERYALAPNEKPLCWLIDRNDEKAGPQWWLMPMKKIFKVINARSQDKKTNALLLVDDPEEGYDVYFIREGTGMKTDYTGVDVDREPSPLHDNEKTQAKWLAYVNDNPLPEILNFQEADYIEKVMSGRVSKKADDDEPEEEVSTARTSRRGRPSIEDSGDPTDEPPIRRTARKPPVEAEAEEAEEPTERPTRRPIRAKASAEPEEEEVEEDARPSGHTARRSGEAEEEIVDEETGEITTTRRATTRKRPAAEPEEEEELPPESRTARASLSKLRPGARR